MRVTIGLLLVMVLLVAAAPARARTEPTTWDIQVAGDVVDESIQTHAYYPRTITIHVGDTVRWRFAGVGSVTFDRFKPLGDHFVAGPDPGDLTAAPSWFPAGGTTYDGSTVVSSGVAFPPLDQAPPYEVTFTTPGLFSYVDVIHPGTSGSVQVLPTSAPLVETPSEAAARGQAEYAEVLAAVRGEVERFLPLSHTRADGSTTHVISMGLSTALGAGANRYTPSALTVRRGDTVVWTNGDDFAPHTVTFPGGQPMPAFLEPRPQPLGPPLLVAPARSIGPVGGTTFSGEGLLNSGFVMYGGSFAVTFDAPPGTYNYACVLHVSLNQVGVVTVT